MWLDTFNDHSDIALCGSVRDTGWYLVLHISGPSICTDRKQFENQ